MPGFLSQETLSRPLLPVTHCRTLDARDFPTAQAAPPTHTSPPSPVSHFELAYGLLAALVAAAVAQSTPSRPPVRSFLVVQPPPPISLPGKRPARRQLETMQCTDRAVPVGWATEAQLDSDLPALPLGVMMDLTPLTTQAAASAPSRPRSGTRSSLKTSTGTTTSALRSWPAWLTRSTRCCWKVAVAAVNTLVASCRG